MNVKLCTKCKKPDPDQNSILKTCIKCRERDAITKAKMKDKKKNEIKPIVDYKICTKCEKRDPDQDSKLKTCLKCREKDAIAKAKQKDKKKTEILPIVDYNICTVDKIQDSDQNSTPEHCLKFIEKDTINKIKEKEIKIQPVVEYKICTKCEKRDPDQDSKLKTCVKCREKDALSRAKQKEKKKNEIKPVVDYKICTSCKKQDPDQDSKLKTCLKCRENGKKSDSKRRQNNNIKKNEMSLNIQEGFSVCNHKNCEIIFPDYLNGLKQHGTKCEKHRELSQKYSKTHEEKKRNKINNCTKCGKDNVKAITKYNKISKYCIECYNKDVKRKRLDRIKYPEKYIYYNAKKRFTKGHQLTRARKIHRLGVYKYKQHNAKRSKEYRLKNPDKVRKITKKSRSTHMSKFNTTKNISFKGNKDFDLSSEEYEDIIDNNNCFYCDLKYNLNIDRVDSGIGYVLENCVTCCTQCNMMKNTFDIYTFLNQCRLICKHLNLYDIQEHLNYRIKNKKSVNYNKYKIDSEKRNKVFELSKEEYNNLIHGNCYLCGISPTDKRLNGIDRVNNDIGYVLSNCKSCCKNCNYIKKDYDIQEILKKVKNIYINCKDIIKNFEHVEYSGPTKKNFTKKSKQELELINKEREIESTKIILDKYDLNKQEIMYKKLCEEYDNQ